MWTATITKATATFLAALSLAACATVYDGKYQYAQGWREATVVSMLQGAAIENPRFWECTREVPEAQRAATNYVLLSFRGVYRPQRRVVPVPADLSLTVGERVYLNLAVCEQAIAKRTEP